MYAKLDEGGLDQLFRTARTYNKFTDEKFTSSDAESIWDLMKFGPTSANLLPARLVWCISDEAKEKLASLAMATNADKIRAAPATVIIGMDLDFHEYAAELFPHAPGIRDVFADPALRQETAMRNSSLQAAYFIMAARALGFGTGPMSGFDPAGVEAAFFSDTPSIKPNMISTIGRGDPAGFMERLPRPAFGRFNSVI